MLKSIGAVAAAVFLWQSGGAAHASTVYTLTLAGQFSGTGTLTISNGPVPPSNPDFVADVTGLTFTIDGLSFSPVLSSTTVAFQDGVLWDITFGWTTTTTQGSSDELSANGTGGLLFDPGVDQLSATITAQLDPTPLPATLPLFATALVGLGLLGWRRRSTLPRHNASTQFAAGA